MGNKGQRVSGQNATMSKTDKMPLVKGIIRIQQKCYKDVTKVLQGCNMV